MSDLLVFKKVADTKGVIQKPAIHQDQVNNIMSYDFQKNEMGLKGIYNSRNKYHPRLFNPTDSIISGKNNLIRDTYFFSLQRVK